MTIESFNITFEFWGSIICFITAFTVFVTRHFDIRGAKALIALMLCSSMALMNDAAVWLFRGNAAVFENTVLRVCNFLYYMFIPLCLITAANYIYMYVKKCGGNAGKFFLSTSAIISGAMLVFLILSRAFGFFYTIDSQSFLFRDGTVLIYAALGIAGLSAILLSILINFKRISKTELLAAVVLWLFFTAATAFRLIYRGVSYVNIILVIFNVLLMVFYEVHYSMDMVDQEKRATETKLRVFNSQIQPHFIYNALNTIMYLCDDNEQASNAISELAGFLQGSVEMINRAECVTAERELETVNHYLNIEKLRFGDDLKVELNIEDKGFMIPAFTLQTLVENAIRHGIRKRSDGKGTLKLNTFVDGDYHIIKISDDGVGFDASEVDSLDESHVGIRNTKQRLELMCKGELEVESAVNNGTTVTVKIPIDDGNS